MSVKQDYEAYTAHGVVVGPNELTVEQSVRLKVLELVLAQPVIFNDLDIQRTTYKFTQFVMTGVVQNA